MRKDGCEIDVHAYNILIDAYGMVSSLKKVEVLWLEMKETGVKANSETFRSVPFI